MKSTAHEKIREEMLDWLVELDIRHYKTSADPAINYKPSGKSHFYLAGSSDRFTSREMVRIFGGDMSKRLSNRWNQAIAEHVSSRSHQMLHDLQNV